MASGSTIQVPVEELLDTANKLVDCAMECDDLLDRLDNAVKALKGGDSWKGDSMEALQAVTDSNSKQYKEITNDLLNLAGILEEFAIKMKEHDQLVKGQIG